MRTNTVLLAFATAALAAAATPAAAQSRYTNEASFLAAAGPGLTTESFQNAAMGDASGLNMGAFSIATNGIADISGGSTSYTVDGTRHLDANIFGTTATPGFVTFTFANAVTAFGANFSSLNNGLVRTYAMVDGVHINLPQDPGFVGFVSLTPFTTISLVNPNNGIFNDEFGVDNVTFRSVSAAVPEPASWAMLIAGFALVGGAMRSRRRSTAVTPA